MNHVYLAIALALIAAIVTIHTNTINALLTIIGKAPLDNPRAKKSKRK